ncbi:tRNA lysidine(34) synthetase TilS [Mesorhizobium sp. PAMC28654]|uniref:tRNA lysidine(34) synthetase TilS n=1 Tax=Mesorhizobium sp. PAMC28654 TaxID=2880934 RepID=UPI001D0BAEBD|nr:tRNA lysidine(34) synthetase TilS [Mesorhizobium sp. PAMC28654]UDL87854.1 tRNA lysidine(34) synthetase TilS [Mesorhizobium sp. PAMC28654]
MLDTEPDVSDFSRIDFTSGAVVAVSGGSDSTALLLLLKDYLDRTAPATKLLAVTIDHNLRPASAAEAQAVAKLCAARNIPHRTLTWSGRKPSTGLPAAAREARYRLLAEAAGSEGIGLVLTGHTADDQAETVLMRQAREKGLAPEKGLARERELAREEGLAGEEGRGLAGMAPATLYDWRCWILRPLLGTRRQTLRDFLRRQHVGWADDPTNADETFERPRIRTILARDRAAWGDAMALAASASAERTALGLRVAALVRGLASQPGPGLVRLDHDFARSGDDRAAVYALRILLATVGGVAFLPDRMRGEALFDRLKDGSFCATLSRTVIDARRTGVWLRREIRGLPLPVAASDISSWDGSSWDGRRRITLGDTNSVFLIAPLGMTAARQIVVPEDHGPPGLLRAGLAAEPALWRAGQCLGLPGNRPDLAAIAVRPAVAPFARFLPSFDLAPAHAVAELIGAPSVPPLPFSGHSAGRSWAKA